MGNVRSRLSYANVVASLALFIALGGSSYAAVQLSKNSVRSQHIKNGQVKGVDLARSSITTDKLRDGSLRSEDFARGELPAGARGDAGPQGPQGLRGETGPTGPQGLKGEPGTAADTSGFVQGSGRLLSNRIVLPPGSTGYNVLLSIPGLGQLLARCHDNYATVEYDVYLDAPVDFWITFARGGTEAHDEVLTGGLPRLVAYDGENEPIGGSASTLSLGKGNDPGERRVATLDISTMQTANNAPCGFQVQGTVWSTP